MTLMRWLVVQPWGQIVCFTFAGQCIYYALMSDGMRGDLDRFMQAGIVLLVAGLAFRALDIWRQRGR